MTQITQNTSLNKFLNETITSARMGRDVLVLKFSNGKKLEISDDAQSCCERRYMSTDDDVNSLVGHKLLRIERKDFSSEGDDNYVVHDTCFVEIGTDGGWVTLVNHNEHNGYYGGFNLILREIE